MILTNRNILIGLGSGILVTGVSVLAYRAWRNPKLILAINYALENRKSVNGDITDFGDVFSGNSYITNTEALANSHRYSIIKLTPDAVKDKLKKVEDGLSRMHLNLGHDIAELKGVFTGLRDKVALAQIAQAYSDDNSGKLLNQAIKDSLQPDDEKAITDIITVKPAFTRVIS